MFQNVKAQDPHFTQFYSAPQFLNPAFTGLTMQHRFSAIYRNQWPGISKAYETYMAAYDYNLSSVNSGLGVYVLKDKAGTGGLSHQQAAFNYAYSIKVNKRSEVRAGLNVSYNTLQLGFNKLTFNDQLITGSSVSKEQGTYSQVQYVDLGAGVLYNTTKYWAGFAAKHLNTPNYSLVNHQEPLPMFFSVHGGYRHIIESRGRTLIKKYFSASFNYHHEQRYDQLDLGFYYFDSPLTIGLWYRGIPIKHYAPGYRNSESIAILAGFEIPKRSLRVGYSYDLTISRLGLNNSAGAHEISLVYEYANKKQRKSKRVLVTCPKF